MRKLLSISIVCAAALLLAGCVAKPWTGFDEIASADYAWPPPPETARVTYVTSIASHNDLFRIGGFGRQLLGALAGPQDSQIARPFAMALHPDGGLLVTDAARHIVHFYDWKARRYRMIGAKREGRLPSPVGVAALPGGDILVSDSRLGSVERFAKDGDLKTPFVTAGVLGRPAGIAVNTMAGEVYVVDVTKHQIAVFDLEGTMLRTLGKRGEDGAEFNFPTHVALSANGNLLVTDAMNFRVVEITRDGTFVREYGNAGAAPGQFSKPKGVAGDANGNVIVVEGLYDALQFFAPTGELLLSLGSAGSGPGEFWLPAGLAIDRENSLLFVADGYNARVQVFRLSGAAGVEEQK